MGRESDPVVIVGAGLAGLRCALELDAAGIDVLLIEASDGPGGRVRTDIVDGFKLDRGFQIFLTAYPEAQDILDFERLDLHPFFPGAYVRIGDVFHVLADPMRDAAGAGKTLGAPVGSIIDKARVGQLRLRLGRGTLEELWDRPETTSLNYLRQAGFSMSMIDGFFRPFLAGVFLEPDLRTSSRMLEFVLRMFAEGDSVVPASGMGAISRQLADRLPGQSIRYNTEVVSLDGDQVTFATGESVQARAVVVATDAANAAKLVPEIPSPGFFGTACLYYAADDPPVRHSGLLLDAERNGPVNNAIVMSNVSPLYAPPGAALISASTVGIPAVDDSELDAQTRDQLIGWWGDQVADWRLLRIYRIPYALPKQEPPTLARGSRSVSVGDGLYVCGDHRENASINGAFASGRRAAEAVIAGLS